MSYRNFSLMVMVSLAASAPFASAQPGGCAAASGGPAASSSPCPVDITAKRSFDMASVERGGKTFAAQCAACHGVNARGGRTTKTDIDLLRSEIVAMDHAGRELPEFLKFGRPEKNMPKFDLSRDAGVDLAAWLHYQVSLVTLRDQYTKLNVFSGDAKAGEAFFNGPVGKCVSCHSVTGDLKGIGAKSDHDAPTLQAAILGGGRGSRGNITATVTLENGEKFTGTPGLINDFVVEIRLPNGETKTWLRNGDWPKVTETNRLQAHIDLVLKYTDDDIHNLAAYLNDK
jgi:cytochrome c oxidase cbb3-type subunit III